MNLMKVNKAECKVLHLGWDNFQYQYRLGDEWIEISPTGKDLGILVDETLDMSWSFAPAAQNADSILDCIKRSKTSRSKEVILSLYSMLVRLSLESCIQFWGCQYKKDVNLSEWVQRRVMKMVGGLEHLSYEERPRELALFSLEKRSLWEDLVTTFQYIKQACKKNGYTLFSKDCCDRTRTSSFKLKEGGFRLDIRKIFLW